MKKEFLDKKICKSCGNEFNLDYFPGRLIKKTDKYYHYPHCRDCYKIIRKENYNKPKNKERQRLYNKNRPKKVHKVYIKLSAEDKIIKRLESQRKWRKNNKDKKNLQERLRYQQKKKNGLLRQKKILSEEQKQIKREKRNVFMRNKRKNDYLFKLKSNISRQIRYYLKSNDVSKNNLSCSQYLGYSIQDLKNYLESKFEYWMNWDNYGSYKKENWKDDDSSTWTWQIDHIIPQSKLPYKSMEDENFKKCWALSNLQPLNSKANLAKFNKIL